jgi:hypothetical protein
MADPKKSDIVAPATENQEPLAEEKQTEFSHDTSLPITKDGIALHPQPTSDPLDPLNWSTWRKNSILAIVMAL